MKGYHLPPVFLAVFVVALLGWIWPMTHGARTGQMIQSVGETEEMAKDIDRLERAVAWNRRSAESLTATFSSRQSVPDDIGRDPFARLTKEVEIAATPDQQMFSELVLSGVIVVGEYPLAVINGEMYGRGSTIREMRVVEIEEDEVVLESSGGERFVLALEES